MPPLPLACKRQQDPGAQTWCVTLQTGAVLQPSYKFLDSGGGLQMEILT